MLGENSFGTAAELARALTGGQKFMKWILIALALLYFIFGCVLCGLGAQAMSGQASQMASTLPKGLIAIGIFLILTSLIGGVSAYKEFRIGLGIYFALLVIWSIILISVGIAVLAASDQQTATRMLSEGWTSLDDSSKSAIQQEWNCCGRNDPNEYLSDGTTPSWGSHGCKLAANAKPDKPNDSSQSACVPTLVSSFQSNFKSAGIAGIVFAVLMIVGLAFTLYLMKGIKDRGYQIAMDKNRARTEREKAQRRARGKGGLKIPDNVL